ncbi:TonB-dependent receptor [candidate division KSB1 bacterium]|nr:TonB-dependent receptor [bacterium]NUM65967.1 TonB-dependent receptor [candidate division KSB1 bacterium]
MQLIESLRGKHALLLLLLAGMLAGLAPRTAAGDKKPGITLRMQNTPLRTAIEKVAQLYGLNILYADATLEDLTVSGELIDLSAEEVLLFLLKDSAIAFKRVSDKQVVLYRKGERRALDISGLVVDSRTGETLPYASIRLVGSRLGATADEFGQFTLLGLPAQACTLQVDYMGYYSARTPIDATNLSPRLQFALQQSILALQPVTVQAHNWEIMAAGPRLSEIVAAPASLAHLPAFGGKDVLRALQHMPGVNQDTNGSAALNIRGGTPAENLILLDGMILQHVDHAFGLLSAINPDVIKDARVYKGGFPARLDGRLSGVVELTGKSGDFNRPSLRAGLNRMAAHSAVELPLAGRGALLLAGRRSTFTDVPRALYERMYQAPPFLDDFIQVAAATPAAAAAPDPHLTFYDGLSKLTWAPSPADVIHVTAFVSEDAWEEQNRRAENPLLQESRWGNRGLSGRWHRWWSNRFNSSLQVSRSRYFVEQSNAGSAASVLRSSHPQIDNEFEEKVMALDNEWKISGQHVLEFGGQTTTTTTTFTESHPQFAGLLAHGATGEQTSLYAQETWQPAAALDLSAGLRATYFDLAEKTFWSPRLAVRVRPVEAWLLKAAWGRQHQYAVNLGSAFPNLQGPLSWLIADNTVIKPGKSDHGVLGVQWHNENYLVDVEIYRKSLRGWLEQSNSVDRTGETPVIVSSLAQRRGTAEGVEVLLQREGRVLNGWISYGYNHTRLAASRTAPAYVAGTDVPHKLKMAANYQHQNWRFAVAWQISSGQPYTIPTVQTVTVDGAEYNLLSAPRERNQGRLPATQRFDLSVARDWRMGFADVTLGAAVFNLFDQRKTWYRHFQVSEGVLQPVAVERLGLTPAISLEVRFE